MERVSSRPDPLILVYPVIALATSYGHSGSTKNLLGDKPLDELVHSLSNETQVTALTPPTFLAHTNEDTDVPAEKSLLFVKRKNRPENQFRATTSPLVVRHQSTGRLVEGLNLRGTNLEIQAVSGERANGGSCEASRSPFGGEPFYQGQNDRRQGVVAYNLEATRAFFVTTCKSRIATSANPMPEKISLKLRHQFPPKSARLSCRSVRITRELRRSLLLRRKPRESVSKIDRPIRSVAFMCRSAQESGSR